MVEMWMVRAGKNSCLIDDFKEMKVVGIGWDIGNIKNKSKEEIEKRIEEQYSDLKKMQIATIKAQIIKFIFDLKKGDYVISYDSSNRIYYLGKIKSDCYKDDKINEKYGDEIHETNYFRNVDWSKDINRDDLKVSTKNTLGSVITVFNINDDAKNDLLNLYKNKNDYLEQEDEEVSILKEDIIEKSTEFIKDTVNDLDWYQMQELVAGLLRAMGYKTIVSPQGPDLGKDIVASPDGLGLEDPIIKVEVKHRNDSMGSSDIKKVNERINEINKEINEKLNKI